MITLEEATTDQIMDELKKRHEGVLLVVSGAPMVEGPERMTSAQVYWRNGAYQALGLAMFAQREILDDGRPVMLLREVEDDDEDDFEIENDED